MRAFRPGAAALIASLLLAACGGSDPTVPGSGEPSGAPSSRGSFTSLVSFGDSLSDLGTYAPATSVTGNGAAPYFGGKWTTNLTNLATGQNVSTVWVENVATALGLVVTPHEVGFARQSVKCPAAADPRLAATCTGYGQGGARITAPEGYGYGDGSTVLTVPVKTQVANHLQRFGGFRDSDLVVVWAGHNDLFVHFEAFAAQAQQIQAQAAGGVITADQANGLLLQAQLAAQAEMKKAAFELAGYVRDDILAKGARYVAVLNLLDVGDTPFGQSLPATIRPVLTGLSEVFNLWLREGLTGQPVRLVDAMSLLKGLIAKPADFGFTNVAIPACDATVIAGLTGGKVTAGTSMFCNTTPGAPFNALRAGASATTWLFADGVHPTVGGHQVLGTKLLEQFRSFGWIN